MLMYGYIIFRKSF